MTFKHKMYCCSVLILSEKISLLNDSVVFGDVIIVDNTVELMPDVIKAALVDVEVSEVSGLLLPEVAIICCDVVSYIAFSEEDKLLVAVFKLTEDTLSLGGCTLIVGFVKLIETEVGVASLTLHDTDESFEAVFIELMISREVDSVCEDIFA